MRQVVVESPRHLALRQAPTLAPKGGELLVKLKATAICGTDLHVYSGDIPVHFPIIPGHESAGIVEEVGEGVSHLAPGDAVAIYPNVSCNRCHLCIMGKENLCPNGGLMGRDVDGSLREHLTVPQTLAFKLPPDVSFAEGALIQPLSTVVHAQRPANIKPGESVVVLGQGTSGLMHTRLSRLSGAYPVIAAGRSRWKLDLALQIGADFAVSATQEDPVAQVLRITDGKGADVVIEAVGIPETIQQALKMAKPGGRIIQYGIASLPVSPLDFYQLYYKEIQVLFPRAMTRSDFQIAIDLVATKRLEMKPFITREYPLEEAGAAFRFFEEEGKQVLRVVITP